ncbi:unnamed protein product, partial [Enterobius vermicularis]|uniref:Uncharacterized protein n=1 Tax=Enterobius vermicularis TaxID=51028 RepID=A0A0N4UU90_ENTVE
MKNFRINSNREGLYEIGTNMGTFITGKAISEGGLMHRGEGVDVLKFKHSNRPISSQPVHLPNVEEVWNLERIGINDSIRERDDDRALQLFENSIKLVNNRYE